jgi:hypothetical protein
MPPLNELYKAYGQMTMQMEILQSQITQVKKQIVDAINAQNAVPAQPKEGE